jgi:hypothetical protein
MGAGFCLIPDYQKEILPGHLAARPLDLDPQPGFDLLVAYRKDDELPALACLLSVVRECMDKPESCSGGREKAKSAKEVQSKVRTGSRRR